MQAPKPFYDVGFWEYVYERERKGFDSLLLHKAAKLRYIKAKDLLALPEADAMQTQRVIKALTIELNTLYGFKIFTDEMRNCYLDNIEKTCGHSFERILFLERELYLLRAEYARLLERYLESLDACIFWNNLLLTRINGGLKNE